MYTHLLCVRPYRREPAQGYDELISAKHKSAVMSDAESCKNRGSLSPAKCFLWGEQNHILLGQLLFWFKTCILTGQGTS